MNKLEGSKTVVVGGKKDVTQQYCGTVGGQSSDFSTMDTEVKVRIIALGEEVSWTVIERSRLSSIVPKIFTCLTY